MGNLCAGWENSRHTGWSSSDPVRSRNAGPIVNARQKAPVPSDSTGSKDVMVSIFIYEMAYDCEPSIFLVES